MARPSIYSDELRARVCKLVTAGVDEQDAFLVEGVSRRTYFSWKSQARDGVEPFAELWEALDEAAGRRNTNITLVVMRAIQRGDVNAAMRMLRAYRPDLHGEKSRVELSGENGGPIQTAAQLRYVVHVPEEEPEE